MLGPYTCFNQYLYICVLQVDHDKNNSFQRHISLIATVQAYKINVVFSLFGALNSQETLSNILCNTVHTFTCYC